MTWQLLGKNGKNLLNGGNKKPSFEINYLAVISRYFTMYLTDHRPKQYGPNYSPFSQEKGEYARTLRVPVFSRYLYPVLHMY
jgi:hypothetical protein